MLPLRLRVRITLHHPRWGSVRLTPLLDRRRRESTTHVLMKFCSYLLYYHPQLQIEQSIGQRHKPDLVRRDPSSGMVRQWIDCGVTSIPKLCRITRQNPETLIHIVKPAYHALRRYRQEAERRLIFPERVRYQSYEKGFLNQLAEGLSAPLDWEATVLEDGDRPVHFYLKSEAMALESRILWAE